MDLYFVLSLFAAYGLMQLLWVGSRAALVADYKKALTKTRVLLGESNGSNYADGFKDALNRLCELERLMVQMNLGHEIECIDPMEHARFVRGLRPSPACCFKQSIAQGEFGPLAAKLFR